MFSKNYRPTAEQKRFWDYLASQSCLNCGAYPVQLHHIIGSSGKENKVHIGQWLLMPLCASCHAEYPHQNGRAQQIDDFLREVLNPYWRRFGDVPMSKDELMAICTWSR